MVDTGFRPIISLKSASPKPSKIFVATLFINYFEDVLFIFKLNIDTLYKAKNASLFSSDSNPNYTEVAPVFERIKCVSNKAFIKKINAVYVFDIEDEGKWHLDLKNGEGSIGNGEPSTKPDVTITLKKETFLKIFNRALKPSTAFMAGEVKLSGDLSKIISLEAMMKSTRNQ